jgi:hypothetical protein
MPSSNRSLILSAAPDTALEVALLASRKLSPARNDLSWSISGAVGGTEVCLKMDAADRRLRAPMSTIGEAAAVAEVAAFFSFSLPTSSQNAAAS